MRHRIHTRPQIKATMSTTTRNRPSTGFRLRGRTDRAARLTLPLVVIGIDQQHQNQIRDAN